MNELEQLRYKIMTGQASPEEMDRFNTLSGQGTQMGLVQNQPTGSTLGMGNGQGIQMPWDQPKQTFISKPNLGVASAGTQKTSSSQPSVENTNLSPAAFETREEYMDYRNKGGFDRTTAGEQWDKTQQGATNEGGEFSMDKLPYLYPGGSDISTELYSLGRSIGAEKGSAGRALSGIAAGGAAVFDIARNVMSGIGFEKKNQYVENWYRNQARRVNYTPNPQYSNEEGSFDMEDGGEFSAENFTLFPTKYGDVRWKAKAASENVAMGSEDPEDLSLGYAYEQEKRSFEEGGQMQPQPQPEGEGGGQQVIAVVIGMLQNGQSPEQVVEALVQRGIPQEQAEQLVAAVTQQGGQNAEQQQEEPEPKMVMKNGGFFDREVGDPIEFMHGGKKIKGVIKSIDKDGNITLK